MHCNPQIPCDRAHDSLCQGDSYFDKVENLKFCMLSSCCILLIVFRTVFVFALGPFLPMLVIFFDFNWNFNGKMANNYFLAIKCSRSVLTLPFRWTQVQKKGPGPNQFFLSLFWCPISKNVDFQNIWWDLFEKKCF